MLISRRSFRSRSHDLGCFVLDILRCPPSPLGGAPTPFSHFTLSSESSCWTLLARIPFFFGVDPSHGKGPLLPAYLTSDCLNTSYTTFQVPLWVDILLTSKSKIRERAKALRSQDASFSHESILNGYPTRSVCAASKSCSNFLLSIYQHSTPSKTECGPETCTCSGIPEKNSPQLPQSLAIFGIFRH